MAIGILDSSLIDTSGAFLTEAVTAQPCYFAIAWGPGQKAAQSTALVIAGATIDTAFDGTINDNGLSFSPYVAYLMGWHPDGLSVYLDTFECAIGYWKVTFPTAGGYTALLSGIPGMAGITVADPAVALPLNFTVTPISRTVFDDAPAVIVDLAFNDTYPAGGIDLHGGTAGLIPILAPQYGHITDTATLRFSWLRDEGKLHIYDRAGEVSGAISFTTRAMFFGLG